MYEYKMVQIPPDVAVREKEHRGNEAAAYLQHIVNDMARQGWEFHRVDPVGVNVLAGCLGAAGGAKGSHQVYYVITFRRELRGAAVGDAP